MEDSISLREILNILKRRLISILMITILEVISISLFGCFHINPIFELQTSCYLIKQAISKGY